MEDLTPEDAEHLMDAAASGASADRHADLAAALGELHAPLPPATEAAPSLGGGVLTGTGRFARRTAVVAAVGVASLVGVAAAGTAGLALLADEPEPMIEDSLVDDAPASTTSTTTSTTTTSTTTTAAPADDADEDGEADETERERGDEIEGLDASDGLDDEELELLCDAAVNHGEYVSAVARDKREGESHGERVSEAAGSDCGKDDRDDDADEDVEDADESDDSDDDAEESDDDGDDADDSDDADDEDGDDDESDDDDDDDDEDGPGKGNGRGKAKGHDKHDD